MESIITTLRSFSLRKLVWFSLGLCIFAVLLLFFTGDFSSFLLSIFIGQLSVLSLTAAIAVYAISNVKLLKIILIIAAMAFLLAIYGLYDAFSNSLISYSELPRYELVAYYGHQNLGFSLCINAVYAVGFVLGFSSLGKYYKITWILFFSVFVLYAVNAFLYLNEAVSDNDYINYNSFIGVLQLVGIIVLLIKGGKKTTDENASGTMANSYVRQNEEQTSFASKSNALFVLKELLDASILTQSEFEFEKSKVLNGNGLSQKQLKDLSELEKLFNAGIISQADLDTQKQTILMATISNDTSESDTSSVDQNNKLNKNTTPIVLGFIAFIVIVVIIIYTLGNNQSSYDSYPSTEESSCVIMEEEPVEMYYGPSTEPCY